MRARLPANATSAERIDGRLAIDGMGELSKLLLGKQRRRRSGSRATRAPSSSSCPSTRRRSATTCARNDSLRRSTSTCSRSCRPPRTQRTSSRAPRGCCLTSASRTPTGRGKTHAAQRGDRTRRVLQASALPEVLPPGRSPVCGGPRVPPRAGLTGVFARQFRPSHGIGHAHASSLSSAVDLARKVVAGPGAGTPTHPGRRLRGSGTARPARPTSPWAAVLNQGGVPGGA